MQSTPRTTKQQAHRREGGARFGHRAVLAAMACAGTVLAAQAAETPRLPEAGAAAAQRRVALVIGNAHYTGVPPLANSINDSADICAALKDLQFDTLCFNDIPTQADFKQRLAQFRAKLGPGAAAVLYYAGHGVEIDGENYLIPTGARIQRRDDIETQTLSMSEVMATLTESKTDFNLVILDACRNSPFTRGLAYSAWRSIGPLRDEPKGSLVLYATAANEQASDGVVGERNSPFAKHLLAHMRQPGLRIEPLVKRVTAAVQAETLKTMGRQQTPYSYGAFTGDFCFAGCNGEVALAQTLPQALPPTTPPSIAQPIPSKPTNAPRILIKKYETIDVPATF